ncbi:penicillin-binding protein activator, partial [Vibrio sinaloensis]
MAMKNHKRLSVTRLLTPVALAVALTACSSGPSTPQSVDITLDPNQPLQTYLMRADSSTGSLQNDWLIMALKASIAADDTTQSELLIKRLSRQNLTNMQQAEWQLARAELLIKQGQHDEALALLNFRTNWQLADEQWKEYHQVRASLFVKQGDYYAAARELSLESRYAAIAEQQFIADSIWANLARVSTTPQVSLSPQSNDAVFSGWLALANYSQTLSGSLTELQSSIEQWLADNPSHPAATYTPQSIKDILSLEITKPVNTALLLPLTGKFATQSQLIRDGFILEMMNDDDRDENATLTVIDTNAVSIE